MNRQGVADAAECLTPRYRTAPVTYSGKVGDAPPPSGTTRPNEKRAPERPGARLRIHGDVAQDRDAGNLPAITQG